MGKEINATISERPLVSIIVPVYKVKPYLEKCINSIVSQTYQNLEVFLVDDGSPDDCGDICEQYAKKYSYIQVIHQKNQGQAAARNNAAKLATGDFIVFVDSDDFVEQDCVEYLVGLQQKYDADMAIGGFYYLYEGKIPPKRSVEENDWVMDATEALIRMNYNKGCGATPWAKIYKRETILNNPFPEGQIYEDLAVLYKIIGDCKTVAMGNRRIYYWLQRTGSTMRMKFDERQLTALKAVEDQVEYVENKFPKALSSAKYRHTAKAVELMSACFSSGSDKEIFKLLKNHMNRYANTVLKDKKAKKTMKFRIIAAKMGYYPAKMAFSIHEHAKKKYK